MRGNRLEIAIRPAASRVLYFPLKGPPLCRFKRLLEPINGF